VRGAKSVASKMHLGSDIAATPSSRARIASYHALTTSGLTGSGNPRQRLQAGLRSNSGLASIAANAPDPFLGY
jgi:hypothetical protein